MTIKDYEDSDYPQLAAAWKAHEWIPCPPEMLPDVGLVSYEGDVFLAYMGMYPSRRGAFVDWAVRNPEADHEKAMKALELIFNELSERARKRGCKFMYSVTKTESWKKRLLSYGMSVAEEGVTSFAMSFNNEDLEFISDDKEGENG